MIISRERMQDECHVREMHLSEFLKMTHLKYLRNIPQDDSLEIVVRHHFHFDHICQFGRIVIWLTLSFFCPRHFWKDNLDTRTMLSQSWSVFIVVGFYQLKAMPSLSTLCCTVYGGDFSGQCWSDSGSPPRSPQPRICDVCMNEKNIMTTCLHIRTHKST